MAARVPKFFTLTFTNSGTPAARVSSAGSIATMPRFGSVLRAQLTRCTSAWARRSWPSASRSSAGLPQSFARKSDSR